MIFHFISKRFLQKKDFPSLLFILKSDIRLLRWFRLRRILLLLLRIGIVISFLFAASNILIPFSFIEPSQRIILDQSLSMKELEKYSPKADVIVPNRGGVSLIHKALKRHPIGILVSDAQRNGFRELLKTVKRYPGIDLERISLPEGNVSIIYHQIGTPFIGGGADIVFTILNQHEYSRNVRSSLFIDGVEFKRKNVSLNQGSNDITFRLLLNEGPHEGYFEVFDDSGFRFDNVRYFSLYILPMIKIVIYSPEYPERLIAALSPSSFEVDWVKEPLGKTDADIFFALGLSYEELSRIVKDSVPGVICLSNKSESHYVIEIPRRVSRITNISIFSPFRDLQALYKIPIYYNFKLNKGKTLIYFENGDAFLKKSDNLIFLPFSLEESDLSLHPVYIPFLYQLIGSLLNGDYSNNILMGQSVIIKTSFEPTIISPDGKRYNPVSIGNKGYLFTRTEKPGIYEISDGITARGYISVNPDPTEALLEALESEEIVNLFGREDYHNGTTFFLVIGFLLFILSIILEKK